MAISKAVDAKRDELAQVAQLLGENLSRRAFGERGPDLQVTLHDLEQVLRPLVEAMSRGFLSVSAAEQAERLPTTLPCPTCGHECATSRRERTLRAENGSFAWPEPKAHCPRCERAFFPSADRAED
jgi:hypothetical protein